MEKDQGSSWDSWGISEGFVVELVRICGELVGVGEDLWGLVRIREN